MSKKAKAETAKLEKQLMQRIQSLAAVSRPLKKKKKKKVSSFPGNGSSFGGSRSFGPMQSAPAAKGRSFRYVSRKRSESKREGGGAEGPRRELVMTIVGDAEESKQPNPVRKGSFLINPGNPTLFPRLSKIAAEFEQYRFHLLRFEYEPTCSTADRGSVTYSVDYTSTAPYAVTEQEAVDKYDSCQTPYWTEMYTNLDPSAMFQAGPRKQIDNSPIAVGDRATKDAGRLDVYVDGSTGVKVGKLYVVYDCELFVPILGIPLSPANLYVSRLFVNSTQVIADNSEVAVAWTNPFSSNASGIAVNPLGIILATNPHNAVADSLIFSPVAQNFFCIATFSIQEAGFVDSTQIYWNLRARWSGIPTVASQAISSTSQITEQRMSLVQTTNDWIMTMTIIFTVAMTPSSQLAITSTFDSADGSPSQWVGNSSLLIMQI